MVRRVDAFAEFSSDPSHGSVIAAQQVAPLADETRIVAYLRSAPVVIDVMERLPDAIDGSPVEASGSLCTDGDWYWREDLAHYVAKYHLRLPPEFLNHVAARNYEPVALSFASLVEATQAVVADWVA